MQIDLSSNVREVIPALDLLFSSQVPFALAKALTETARAVADAMPQATQEDLDRPTAFTQRGFYATSARKDALEATVGPKDRQAEYLAYQVEGGARQPARKALRLPVAVELDAFGNLPKGVIRQLIARAKAGKRTTKTQAQRFGVSQGVELFYGDPADDRPPGIYKRTVSGGRSHLVPLIVFPARAATYRPRFDFYGHAVRVVDRTFDQALDRAWALALATAR